MKKWIVPAIGIIVGVVAIAAIACEPAPPAAAPAPSDGEPPAASTPIATIEPTQPPVTGPISILDTMDPKQCSFMHNINACFSDGEPPADVPMGSYMEVFHLARFDVVERFGLNLEAIVIKALEAVEWGDTSLGNPEPGMMYAQVIVPGFKLVLESRVSGSTYTYHTSTDRVVFIDSTEGTLNEEPVAANSDTAQIVELVLNWALVEQRIPDFGLLDDQQNIILSLENIDAELVPQLPGINLILLSPEEIQRKADEDGDFLRLNFQLLRASNKT